MKGLTQIEQIASKFSMALRELLTQAEMDEVVIRNEEPRYKDGDCCATHDFCDANIVMAEAFIGITGREVDLQSDNDMKLWNDSWVLAKSKKFEA